MLQNLRATKAQPSRYDRLFELLRQENQALQHSGLPPKRPQGDFLADRLMQSATASLRRSR